MLRGRRCHGPLRAAVFVLAWAGKAWPEDATSPLPARRGPFETREGWLLAQRRLTLPAVSPDPLPHGETRLRLDLDWGNDFARRVGSYLVDGEHRALALTVRRGVTESLTLSARLPLLWRGGGFLDRFADLIHKLGFPDNGRPFFPRDVLLVRGFDPTGFPIAWDGGPGTALGKLELQAMLAPLRREASRLSLAVVGRAALPTGGGPFAGGGVEGGAQLAAVLGLGQRWDGYAGAGLAVGGEREAEGLQYRSARSFGHVAVEWRFARRWSALAQIDGGGRLVTNLKGYPRIQSYLRLGLKRDLGGRTTLEGAFSENLKNQQATTDFGVYLALVRRF